MKGWHKESYRHYLAAKHIKTSKIKVVVRPLQNGRMYPVSKTDVQQALKKENTNGLTVVELANPKDKEQKNAYAQYMRGKRKLVIFSQPVVKQEYFVERKQLVPKQEMTELITKKVIPHEMSHHHILYRAKLTDKDVEMAEARAEALRRGYDYKDDRVVKKFIGAHV